MASNNIIKKLKSHFGVFTDTALADKLNVSQPTIASWKNRKIPNHILMQYATILGDLVQADSDMVANREPKTVSGVRGNAVGVQEQVVVENQPIHITKGEEQVDASYIIDLQKDKIEHQAIEIKTLKDALQKKQAESVHWEELPYDFISGVTLKRKGLKIGRTVDLITGIERQSEILGYSISELEKYWSVGTFYKFNEHPIDNIIAKESLKEIDKKLRTLPYMFDSIKSIVGDHYIPQPLMYIAKNGEIVCAVAYAKVEWRTLKVTAKVQFLIHMPSV